jgi:uncharacterized protein (TIGR02145 family)
MKTNLIFLGCMLMIGCDLERIPDAGPFVCGQDFIDPRDGKTYKTVWIANNGSHNVNLAGRCWYAENANFDTGNFFSSCYDENDNLCDSLGTVYHDFTRDNACPEGWHSATQAEWSALFKTYGWTEIFTGNGPLYSGPNAVFLPGGISQMDILMGGHCEDIDSCVDLGTRVNYWASENFHTTSISPGGSASILLFQFINNDVRYYVRCVQDSI